MARTILWLVIPSLVSFAVGCTSCPHRARYDALKTEACPGLCGAQRDGVVAIVVGPETVFDFARVGSLTQRLNEAGFARVYRGGPLHMAWLEREVKRTHAEEPDTQFVIVGYALGGRTAHALAANLGNAGVPVDSLVLLDPFALDHSYSVPDSVHVTVVRSNGWSQGRLANAVEMAAPGVGHIDLPNNPETVGTVVGVLATVASRVPVNGAPDDFGPRPAHLGTEWDFVLGPSAVPAPLGPPQPRPTPERTASVTGK
jgi:pimeloyl-ACP methyl ester carboxylesterase